MEVTERVEYVDKGEAFRILDISSSGTLSDLCYRHEIGKTTRNGETLYSKRDLLRAANERQAKSHSEPQAALVSRKSRGFALFLCIFFGPFGFHRFYVGKSGTGLLWLFSAGVMMIGWIVDIVQLCRGEFRDKRGYPLR
jgi:hypothetical protein